MSKLQTEEQGVSFVKQKDGKCANPDWQSLIAKNIRAHAFLDLIQEGIQIDERVEKFDKKLKG